jgi:hypothetical protein
MKLIAVIATLAVAADARRNRQNRQRVKAQRPALRHTSELVNNIRSSLSKHVRETADGFIVDLLPYFKMEVLNDGLTGSMMGDLRGINGAYSSSDSTNLSWNIISQDGSLQSEINLRGGMTNGLAQFLPPLERLDAVENYDMSYSGLTTWSMLGLKHKDEVNTQWSWVDNSPTSSIDAQHDLEVSYDMARNSLTVNAEYNADLQVNNLRNWPNSRRPVIGDSSNFPWTVNANSAIEINNVKNCRKWVQNMDNAIDNNVNCVIGLRTSAEVGDSQYTRQQLMTPQANLAFRPYALIAKATMKNIRSNRPSPSPHTVFIRGESVTGKSEKLNLRNFRGIYYTNKNNWQTAIQQNDVTLLLRIPGMRQIEGPLAVLAWEKFNPWQNFWQKLNTHIHAPLYLLYNADKFLRTFDDEFDCSKMVVASRIESDLWREYIQPALADAPRMNRADVLALPGQMNILMSQMCSRANNEAVKYLAHPEISVAMTEVRRVVEDVSGPSGQKKYEELFAGVF